MEVKEIFVQWCSRREGGLSKEFEGSTSASALVIDGWLHFLY